MNEADEKKVQELLKQSMRPVDHELGHDLWPQMLQRLQERPAAVPWFDWALLAVLAVWFFLSPAGIPLLLYHL
jgi:hypothetical protein